MLLFEHQAKSLISTANLPVPEGLLVSAGQPINGFVFPVVVKSQVPVGGRGKLGGVRLANNQQELEEAVATILQLEIKGYKPKSVLIEPALEIEREMYISLRVNRDKRIVEYIVSQDGGVEIESKPENVKVFEATPDSYELIAKTLQLDELEAKKLCQKLEVVFTDNDCLLLEINPLVITKQGTLYCADAKIQIDDNARFRQENLPWEDISPLKPLGGNIGVVANGAGMAMSTMDTIYASGGKPANFLDIGGGTGEELLVNNLRAISDLPGVDSIIVNIFAGITRCDDIARGIIAARKQIPSLPQLFIRLEGTNREEAARLLEKVGVKLQPDLKSCVEASMKLSRPAIDQDSLRSTTDLETTLASTGVDLPKQSLSPKETFPLPTQTVGSSTVRDQATLLLKNHKTVVQGITGHHGSFHTQQMLASGTRIVAGVTPGRVGQKVHGVPVYDNVQETVTDTGASASVIFVPARFAKNALYEAIDAGISLIVCITEGIPVHDMLDVRQRVADRDVTIVGPNCPGLIVPGSHKLGIIASQITSPGETTIISRSGTLTYELADALTKKAIGQRLILGIGGDPVQGMTFIESLIVAQADPGTKQIVIVGEIGGESENIAADYIKNHVTKPVYGLVVGHSLPAGQTFGHAGAIVGHRGETASAKTEYMALQGIHMSHTLDELINDITS